MTLRTSNDEVTTLSTFVKLSLVGLQHACGARGHVEMRRKVASVLNKPDPFGSESEYQAAIGTATELETFGQSQRAGGFPYLYDLAVIKLWSVLETMADDIVLESMLEYERYRGSDVIKDLKGPLIEFVAATKEEQAEFLLDELKLATRASLRPGVARFEALFESVGLGGAVDSLIRKTLLELWQVRNVVVHRSGMVDKRFLRYCPWTTLTLGDRIVLSELDFSRYTLSADWYYIEAEVRLNARDAKPQRQEAIALQRDVLKRLHDLDEARFGPRKGEPLRSGEANAPQ